MYKIHNNLSPSIMKTIFPERSMSYNLRNNIPFQSSNVNTVYYGTETLSFRDPKTWALVPEGIKYSKILTEFKAKIRTWNPIGCTCKLCKIYIANLGFLYVFVSCPYSLFIVFYFYCMFLCAFSFLYLSVYIYLS